MSKLLKRNTYVIVWQENMSMLRRTHMISHEEARKTAIGMETTECYYQSCDDEIKLLTDYISQQEQQSNDFIEKYESLEIKYFQFVQDAKRLLELLSVSCDVNYQYQKSFSKQFYEHHKKNNEIPYDFDVRMTNEIDELKTKLKGHSL